MTRENERKLRNIIKNICRLEVEETYIENKLEEAHCNLMEELGFDSLLIVELIVEIEEVLGFDFDMNSLDINTLKFYDGLIETIKKYIG